MKKTFKEKFGTKKNQKTEPESKEKKAPKDKGDTSSDPQPKDVSNERKTKTGEASSNRPSKKDDGDTASKKPQQKKDSAEAKGNKATEKKPTSSKAKISGPEITDPVKVDVEPVLEQYLLEGDYSDKEEYLHIIYECARQINSLNEALSVAQRVRRRSIMRRSRARIRLGRQRSMRRRAMQSRINSRARRGAISALKRRFSGGRNPNRLSYAERARVENLVKRRQGAVNRLQRRLVRVKRQQDNARFNRKR